MAHEHAGPSAKTPWTKIFTAFRIALDLKKLLLAAAGIVLMSVGWQALSWVFHGVRAFPEWTKFDPGNDADLAAKDTAWNEFKASRASWNLLHELAGGAADRRVEDAADLTKSLDDFLLVDAWAEAYRRSAQAITVNVKDKKLDVPGLGNFTLSLLGPDGDALAAKKNLTVAALKFNAKDAAAKPDAENKKEDLVAKGTFYIDGILVAVESKYDTLKTYCDGAKSMKQIETEATAKDKSMTFGLFKTHLAHPKVKPSGKLSTSPWSEDRGENPYLLVADQIKTGSRDVGVFTCVNQLSREQAPVLLEPLFKFLLPLKYMVDPRARTWDRLYLILVMLWTIAVWGFFGGAICRIAAVQVARNERITLKEAIQFTRDRFLSYVVAPIFPLALVAILTLVLMIFGWLIWTPWIGEVIAGLLWPIVILLGFIIAIVLVGLVGWPLMNATISTEGSDSFDALSRSYSYVYQAPWQFLWYNFLAIVYGAVLVFFVGFMASLMVFGGKWGVGCAWGLAKSDPASDREPSYLFENAPTSFGWRDLLISNSQHAKKTTTATGREFTKEYQDKISTGNRVGGFLVSIWIYLLFVLVLGFSYSYFWSASTLIYFLMRHHVDDTDMDEVHLEDEGLDDPFAKPTPTPAPPTPAPAKPGTISLNVVDAPQAPEPAPSPPSNGEPSPTAPATDAPPAGGGD